MRWRISSWSAGWPLRCAARLPCIDIAPRPLVLFRRPERAQRAQAASRRAERRGNRDRNSPRRPARGTRGRERRGARPTRPPASTSDRDATPRPDARRPQHDAGKDARGKDRTHQQRTHSPARPGQIAQKNSFDQNERSEALDKTLFLCNSGKDAEDPAS